MPQRFHSFFSALSSDSRRLPSRRVFVQVIEPRLRAAGLVLRRFAQGGRDMVLSFLSSFWKEAAGLLCLAAIFVGGRYVAASIQPKSTHFQSVREFREFATSSGLHLHGGTAAGNGVFAGNNCYVADHS